jgi:hypothetical protein
MLSKPSEETGPCKSSTITLGTTQVRCFYSLQIDGRLTHRQREQRHMERRAIRQRNHLRCGSQEAQVDFALGQRDQVTALYRQQVLSAFRDVEDQLSALRVLKDEGSVTEVREPG